MAEGDCLKKVEADCLAQHDEWKAAAHALGVTVGFSAAETGFNKRISRGVHLYCQRGSEAARVFLARATSSPYVDNRPLLVANTPETRKHTAIYVVGTTRSAP